MGSAERGRGGGDCGGGTVETSNSMVGSPSLSMAPVFASQVSALVSALFTTD